MMYELSECRVITAQMNGVLPGKVVQSAEWDRKPHKFAWYNLDKSTFQSLMAGKTIGRAHSRGKWIFIEVNPGYTMLFGEMCGRIQYHPAGDKLPEGAHMLISFTDGSALSSSIQMWGAIELHEKGKEEERKYIVDMPPLPGNPLFTREYFHQLIKDTIATEKRSVKSLLCQEQTIPGLGNSAAMDIMLHARLNPKRSLDTLSASEIDTFYDSIMTVTDAITAAGGRYDEPDLFGKAGGYVRKLDKKTAGKACPACGNTIQKINYLGGATYFCPGCQR